MRVYSMLMLLALGLGQSQAAVTLATARLLHGYECSHCEQLAHGPLNAHWPASNYNLNHQVARHQQKSKKYLVMASLKQLQQGVAIYTLAPEAVIRITPQKVKPSIKPQFSLATATQGNLSLKEASSLYAQDEASADVAPFDDQSSIALQLKPDLGAGKFIVQSDSSIVGHENDVYAIHVFDKLSSVYLTVATDKPRYHYGEDITATISLGDDAIGYPIDIVRANMVAPNGEVTSLSIEQTGKNIYQGKAHLSSEKAFSGQSWYIEAEVETNVGSDVVKRHVHTAFSYVIPSAEIHTLDMQATTTGFDFTANVEVATGSRYMLQATLLATDSEGNQIPVEITQAADWLTPGLHQMNFSFTPELVKKYAPPYYVADIKLLDYGQMKPVFEYNKIINLMRLRNQ